MSEPLGDVDSSGSAAAEGKRALVVVRMGAHHRVGALLNVPREARCWDLAVSLYDDIDLGCDASAEIVHQYKGGKWDGIHRLFTEMDWLLSAYDRYWLVDDDIEVEPEQVEALFRYVREQRFELAQPALTLDSFYSHRLTLCCEGFRHRYSNLVEIMAPIVTVDVMRQVLPWLQCTRSGFGIDWFWQTLVSDPRRTIAIIDALPVAHRRPLRQHLRGRMQLDSLSPERERMQLVNALSLKRIHAVAMGGVLQDDREVTSRLRMGWLMFRSYWRTRHRIATRRWTGLDFAILWWRQMFAPLGYAKKKLI